MKSAEVWDYHSLTCIRSLGKETVYQRVAHLETIGKTFARDEVAFEGVNVTFSNDAYCTASERSKVVTVSSTVQSSLSVWSLKTGKRTALLLGHMAPILSVDVITTREIDRKKLNDAYEGAEILCVSGSSHGIRLW